MINRSVAFEVQNVTSHLGANSTVYFNACHPLNIAGCSKTSNAVALVKNGEQCEALSMYSEKASDGRTSWVFNVIDPIYSVARALKSMAAVRKFLQLKNVEAAVESIEQMNLSEIKEDFGDSKGLNIVGNNVNNTLPYNLNMVLNCNDKITQPQNMTAVFNSATGYTLSLEDNNACSFDAFSFWKKLGWGQYIVEGVIALFALVLCVAGIRMYKPTILSIGFLAGAAITYIFLNLFVENAVGQDWWFWVIIGISVLVGVLCGLLLFFLNKLAFATAGAFLGYVLGNFTYELVLHKLDGAGSPVYYYVCIVVMALIFGILSCWLQEIVIILATSIGGAYVSVRMVGTMAGKYPDESFIAQEIASGEYESMPLIVFVFLAVMAALAILGLVLQFKAKREINAKEEHKDRKDNYFRV